VMQFYVNDASTVNDEWCTAIGDDSNDGLSPATPMASVQAVLDTYNFGPGDVLHIDTGTYDLSTGIVINSGDKTGITLLGAATGVVFNGIPTKTILEIIGVNALRIQNLTLMNGLVGISLRNSDQCVIDHISIVGMAYSGISIKNDSDNTLLTNVECSDNGGHGISIESDGGSSGDSAGTKIVLSRLIRNGNSGVSCSWSTPLTVENTVVAWNGFGSQGFGWGGIDLNGFGTSILRNNTIAFNNNEQITKGGIYGDISLINNIVVASGPVATCYYQYLPPSYGYSADYNCFHAVNGATVAEAYEGVVATTLDDWRTLTGNDINSISADPLFADIDLDDFHLRSPAGRFTKGGIWVVDAERSPCIDLGNPASSFADEPSPNGGRANVGAYGGTEQASKSTGTPFINTTSNSSGNVRGKVTLRWIYGGISAEENAHIEYSTDAGRTWETLAEAVPLSAGFFLWDTSAVPIDSPVVLWRISLDSDPSVSDVSDNLFALRNHGTPFTFYVNDGDTAGDMYCSAAGHSENLGVTPDRPMIDPQAVFDTYDLEPGDTVLLDRGRYDLTDTLWIGSSDGGAEGNPVIVQGATNARVGQRTVIQCTGTQSEIIRLDHADHVELRSLDFDAAGINRDGVLVNADNAHLHGCSVLNAQMKGIELAYADQTIIENCIVSGHGTGIDISETDGVVLMNSTVVSSSGNAVWISASYYDTSLDCRNNILMVSGVGRACVQIYELHWLDRTSYSGDHNLLFADDGATIGPLWANTDNLAQWQTFSGQDANSLSEDPFLAYPAGGDFHLLPNSPCRDAGDNSVVAQDAVDIDGEARIAGSAVDIGADEFFDGPEIAVHNGETTAAEQIMDEQAAAIDFGYVVPGGESSTQTFTIANYGTEDLQGLVVSIDGIHADDFTVAQPTSATLVAGGKVTFTVTFTAGGLGSRIAVVHIANNDTDEDPFDFDVVGFGATGEEATVDHFAWAAIASPQTAGVPFAVELVACNAAGGWIATYAAEVNLTAMGDNGALPLMPETINLLNGRWFGDVTVNAAGTGVALTADDGAGHIGESTTFDVLKHDQMVVFDPLPVKMYGDNPFSVSATASSGLPVTLASNNEAVVTVTQADGDAWTATIRGAGTATITASQPGDGNWNAAAAVEQELVVQTRPLAVTPAAGQSKVFGTADPVFAYEYDGAVESETPSCTGALARTEGEAVGTYKITQGNLGLADNGAFLAANYTLAFTEGVTFAITDGTVMWLTVTPDNMENPITLVFGETETAALEEDAFDIAAIPGQGTSLCSLPMSASGNRHLSRDFRPFSGENGITRWRLVIAEPGLLGWDISAALPERQLYLQQIIDEQPVGYSIDMRVTSSVTVTGGSVYEIAYAPITEATITLKNGWNFIGCPVMSTQSERELFDSLIHSSDDQKVLWHWRNGIYKIWPENEPLRPEIGYFVYSHDQDRTISVTGIRADAVMLLQPGWNLVSPPSDCAIPAAEGIVSRAWHLHDSTYQFVVSGGTLKAGCYYWIFVNASEPVMVIFAN
ncbi:MAG: choice-of-anchor D domain-containing protein, partial [Lentisphaerae bacterium]|nr:choice-of-anchor D domain-containing protein [Lentisphaerota bacterium]